METPTNLNTPHRSNRIKLILFAAYCNVRCITPGVIQKLVADLTGVYSGGGGGLYTGGGYTRDITGVGFFWVKNTSKMSETTFSGHISCFSSFL